MTNNNHDLHKCLLEELQKDAKRTHKALAIEAQTSEATAARHVRELEQTGVIRGYHADVDPSHLGLKAATFVVIKLKDYDAATLNQFQQLLREDNRITECHSVMGEEDYILKMHFPNDEAYHAFIQMLLDSPIYVYSTTYQTIRMWKPRHPLPLDYFGTA